MSIQKKVTKGKTKYIARIYIKTVDGVVRHNSKTFERLKDAQEYEAQFRNFKKNRIDKTVSNKVLLSVVFENYIQKCSVYKKDNTIKTYKATFYKWVEPNLGMLQVGSIQYLTLVRFFDAIKKQGASDYMVNYVHVLLFDVFKFASSSVESYIIENPMRDMPRARIEYNPSESVKFWTKKEIEKILNACIGSKYYLIISLMVNTGIRVSEAAALTPKSFDLEKGVLNVTNQLTIYLSRDDDEKKSRLVLNQTKNKTTRSIPLNKRAMEIAKLLIERNDGNYFLLMPDSKSKQVEIALKRGKESSVIKANVISAKTLGNALKKICEKARVDYIGPHGLRHSFAANFLMNGGDIFTLSIILGHKNITSTQIYSHLTESYLKSALNIVEFGG